MKTALLITTAILLLSFSVTKEKNLAPPGTVQITENFFADECEISNLSWLEYEYWTAQFYGKNSKEYLATLPDTLVWRNPTTYNEAYVTYYHRHKAYREYPVVGISYEQAIAFCKWRTERVKTFYSIRNKKTLAIQYRLPTASEWEFISQGALPKTIIDKKTNQASCNLFKPLTDTSIKKTANSQDILVPIKSLQPNYFGIFNIIGNVAEMVAEKNICKGGSWQHQKEEARPGKNIEYSKPEAWIGFRCVCDYTLNSSK